MNPLGAREEEQFVSNALMGGARPQGARARVVNRTRRVVRQQALTMQEQRRRSRSLWVPLAIVSVLLLAICYAFWSVLDGYELTPNGIPDASDQLMILLVWFLPVTAFVLGAVWVKRGRGRAGSDGEVQQ
ncbi:MAG: hypothetical protein HIU91_09990 [Acidobacteria bacterium]|nr:hypothetical protein [Acidobacteriota bacterium]